MAHLVNLSVLTISVALAALGCGGERADHPATPAAAVATASPAVAAVSTVTPLASAPTASATVPAASPWVVATRQWFLDGEMLEWAGAPRLTPASVSATQACLPYGQAVVAAETFQRTVPVVRASRSTSFRESDAVAEFITIASVVRNDDATAQAIWSAEASTMRAATRGECLSALLVQSKGTQPGSSPYLIPRALTSSDIQVEDLTGPEPGITGFRLSAPSQGWLALLQSGAEVMVGRQSAPPPTVGVMTVEHWILVSGPVTLGIDYLSYSKTASPKHLPPSALSEYMRQLRESRPRT